MSRRADYTSDRARNRKVSGSGRSASKSASKNVVVVTAKGSIKSFAKSTSTFTSSKTLKRGLMIGTSRSVAGSRPKIRVVGNSQIVRDARARLAALPTGFTDWIHDLPPWPDDSQEVLGPADEIVR
jgi:hypothetical protein